MLKVNEAFLKKKKKKTDFPHIDAATHARHRSVMQQKVTRLSLRGNALEIAFATKYDFEKPRGQLRTRGDPFHELLLIISDCGSRTLIPCPIRGSFDRITT